MKSLQSFIFIGRSGCGKGTQAKMLIDYLKVNDPLHEVLYVETGGEFREFLKNQETYTEKLAATVAKTGGLVPEFLAIYLWSHKIISEMSDGKRLVVDGTPRKYDEALVIDSVFEFYNMPRPHVVYLNVGEEWSKSRLMERQRVDDGEKEIKNRLQWFTANVVPAIEYFKKNPLYTFHDIDGERGMAEIHDDIRKIVTL